MVRVWIDKEEEKEKKKKRGRKEFEMISTPLRHALLGATL